MLQTRSTITLLEQVCRRWLATRPWRNIQRFSLGWLGSELGGEGVAERLGVWKAAVLEPGASAPL